jgi:hypothetical protein
MSRGDESEGRAQFTAANSSTYDYLRERRGA